MPSKDQPKIADVDNVESATIYFELFMPAFEKINANKINVLTISIANKLINITYLKNL